MKTSDVTKEVSWTPGTPLVYWIEAVEPSSAKRDISITLTYRGRSDTVKATAVWATLSQSFHDTASAQSILSSIAGSDASGHDVGSNVVAILEKDGGAGLRPFDANRVPAVPNTIMMQWKVVPAGLATEPVNIDVARRADGWLHQFSADNAFDLVAKSTSALKADEANDDPDQEDETAWNPSSKDHVYSIDEPGASLVPRPEDEAFKMFVNFSEYIRVGFGDVKPQGNTDTGSRASDFWAWYVSHTLIRNGQVWERSPDNSETEGINDVAPGHIVIPSPPQ